MCQEIRERSCQILVVLTVITAMLKDSFQITPILMNSQTNQDPFEYYPCSVASPSISLVSFLCPAILASHLLQFARLASRKTVLQKNDHSTLRALHTRVVWGFMFKFHQELSFASTDWLSYLSELSVRHLFVAVLFAKQEIFLSLFPQ